MQATETKKLTVLLNHNTEETAYMVNDYPYGYTLRTKIRYWVESTPKKGDRFVSQTLNPKTNKWNAPKKCTYKPLLFLVLNEENHVKTASCSIYCEKEKITKLIDFIGGIEKLNEDQLKMYNSLMGIKNPVSKDKVYSIKWEKNRENKYNELKITFDRPDNVSLKEIFEAMTKVNQEKLTEVFEQKYGLVRICVRGGIQLTTVHKESYNNFLAINE